jgi:hypothetical protein
MIALITALTESSCGFAEDAEGNAAKRVPANMTAAFMESGSLDRGRSGSLQGMQMSAMGGARA